MAAARYEVLSTLPPGGGTATATGTGTRLAWQVGEGGVRYPVVLREVTSAGGVPATAPVAGVLPLLDRIELEGRGWAVYEFIPGVSLVELANAHFAVERLPSLGLIGRVVVDACRAIHRVHTRVDEQDPRDPEVHGGLSDASVFVGFDGGVRVLDLNAPRLGKFVAPEVDRGELTDPRADIFSLGAVLHHVTTRFAKAYAATMARAPSPKEFPPPSAVHPEATFKLDAVVMRALMPSPGSRFASAGQLAEELEKVLGPLLFTPAQVSEVVGPLFIERMAALKALVDPKKRPGPRPSGARPAATRRSANALDAVAAREVAPAPAALGEVEELPTQANRSLPASPVDFDPHATAPGKAPGLDFDPHATGPGNAAKLDFDPHATTPGKTVPSRPSGNKRSVQPDEERARARGQEKISTADLDPDQLSPELKALQGEFDGGELGAVMDEPTRVKPKVKPRAEEADDEDGYVDPKKKESTLDDEPEDDDPEIPRSGWAGKLVFALFALIAIAGGSFVALNFEQLKARLRPPPPPATVTELPYEESFYADARTATAGDPAEALVAAPVDAGARDSGVADAGVADAGVEAADAGTVVKKKTPPVNKKKKKKRRR